MGFEVVFVRWLHFHLTHIHAGHGVGAIPENIFALQQVGATGDDGVAGLQAGFNFDETVSFLAGLDHPAFEGILGSLNPDHVHAGAAKDGIGWKGYHFSLRVFNRYIGGHTGSEQIIFIGDGYADHVDPVVWINFGIDKGDFSLDRLSGQIGELDVHGAIGIEPG